MAYKLRNQWVNGVPPAPLIGEQLSAIDFDFMRIKAPLRKEIPFLTMEEIWDKDNNVCLPGECIIGELIIAGFQDSAVEIRELIRQDLKERQRQGSRAKRSECLSKPIPLGENTKKLRMLSEIFSELEQLANDGRWKMIIISRLELAEALQKTDTWLAQQIVKSCFRFISNLEESVPEDRIIIAEVHLTKAYYIFTGGDLNQEKLHNHLQMCFQMVVDHKDKKMYSIMSHKGTPKRQGLIKISIERPVGLHGWHNYEKVATVQEVVTLRNTSLYRIACIIACLSQLNLAQQQKKDLVPGLTSSGGMLDDNLKVIKELQRTFSNAIAFAKEGENTSCLLQAIYICGEYMKTYQLHGRAQYVYHKLLLKSREFKDQETLGITYNRLGNISKRLHFIKEAANYFVEEWEIGQNFNQPILRIDALSDLGKLLLEEGHVIEAENISWHAYEELSKVILEIPSSDSKGFENMKYSFTGDPIYEKAWTMNAIIAGQSQWPRFAGNCRNLQFYPITLWQTSRHPIHAVWHPKSQKPVKITSSKHHYDTTKLGKKMAKQLNLMCVENYDKYSSEVQWLKKVDNEDFSSIHDLIVTTNKQKLSTSISEESEEINKEFTYEIDHDEVPDSVEDGETREEEIEANEEVEAQEEEVEAQEKVQEEQYIIKEEVDPRDLSWISEMVTTLQEIYNRRRSRAEEEFRAEVLERVRVRALAGQSEENSSEEEDEHSHSPEISNEEEESLSAHESGEEYSSEEDEEVSSPSDDEQEWDGENDLNYRHAQEDNILEVTEE